jgi:hypothetical protein
MSHLTDLTGILRGTAAEGASAGAAGEAKQRAAAIKGSGAKQPAGYGAEAPGLSQLSDLAVAGGKGANQRPPGPAAAPAEGAPPAGAAAPPQLPTLAQLMPSQPLQLSQEGLLEPPALQFPPPAQPDMLQPGGLADGQGGGAVPGTGMDDQSMRNAAALYSSLGPMADAFAGGAGGLQGLNLQGINLQSLMANPMALASLNTADWSGLAMPVLPPGDDGGMHEGGGGGGGSGRKSKPTRRGPMDEMRQLVRILVKARDPVAAERSGGRCSSSSGTGSSRHSCASGRQLLRPWPPAPRLHPQLGRLRPAPTPRADLPAQHRVHRDDRRGGRRQPHLRGTDQVVPGQDPGRRATPDVGGEPSRPLHLRSPPAVEACQHACPHGAARTAWADCLPCGVPLTAPGAVTLPAAGTNTYAHARVLPGAHWLVRVPIYALHVGHRHPCQRGPGQGLRQARARAQLGDDRVGARCHG